MKFHLAVNLERMNDATDMMAVQKHTLEMVQMADRAGFEIAWAAEHHVGNADCAKPVSTAHLVGRPH